MKQDISYCADYCSGQTSPPEGTGAAAGSPSGNGGTTYVPPLPGGSAGTGPSNGGTSPENGGAPSAGNGGLGGAPAGGSPSSGGAPAGSGGASTGGPPGTAEFDITSSTFPVAAGQETYQCQNFKNPNAQDVAIVESDSFMAPGSHHMFVFHDPSFDSNTNTVAPCSGTEFHSYIHAAQTPQVTITYPPNVGRSLKATEGLRILAHYLNTTSSNINAQVEIKFYTVAPSAVQYLAAEMFLNNGGVTVPPGNSTATRTFNVPYEIKMLNSVSHMHRRGVHFRATTSGGQVIYDGTEWDEPEATAFDPAMDIAGGSTITWACDYVNPGNTTYTFGESAQTNEMCILNAVFYPTTLGTEQGQPLDVAF